MNKAIYIQGVFFGYFDVRAWASVRNDYVDVLIRRRGTVKERNVVVYVMCNNLISGYVKGKEKNR